jgi:outer membrane protein TolC
MTALFALALASAGWALPPAERVAVEALGDAGAAYSVPSEGPPPSAPWWDSLGDDGLAALLDEALASNHAVLASWERVTVARAGAWQSGSALMPTAQVSAGWNRLSTEPMAQQFLNQLTSSNPGVPVDVLEEQVQAFLGDSYDTRNWALSGAWNVDLFGVATTSWLASRWDARAMDGSRAAQAMVVAATVGGAWYDLVAARQRLAFVDDQVRISRDLLELVQLRYRGGEATALDVLQQKQQVANIEATHPAAAAAVDRSAWRLAALIGRSPSAVTPDAFQTPARLLAPPGPPPLGTPADLVTRRPDLVASAATAEAADLRRLSGWLGLAPTLTLQGSTGDQGQLLGADADEWADVGNWSYGVKATVPVFNGGRKIAAARGATASAHAAFHDLQQDTLDAVVEVESSRRVLQQRREEVAAREALVSAATLSFEESRTRYTGGLVPYVNVMTALNTLQSAELALIQARRDLLGAHIDLHNSLGAPWALDLDRPGRSGGN